MRKTSLFLPLLTALLFFSGCGLMKQQIALNMADVRIGMQKEEVMEMLGRPQMVVSAYTTEAGDVIEVLEYVRYEHNSLTDQNEVRPIWTYFINNELFEWGPGESWELDSAFRRSLMNRSRDYQTKRSRL
ncbi:DUF3192 domain-containing protein [Sphingobacterium corticis]|uniref:DUF3192 domain-containing protein n=1 Tax=Sphingobacterium corticis TaxID=1812823 RepID=A0ABW5NQK1_9SPHI